MLYGMTLSCTDSDLKKSKV